MPRDTSRSTHAGPSQSMNAPRSSGAGGRSSAFQSHRQNGTESQDHRYNPVSDPEKKRKIRKDYRNLISQVQTQRTNKADDFTTKDLKRTIEQADVLIKRVEAPSESVLDSRLLLMTSELGAQMAQKLKVGTEFDIEDFLAKTCSLIGGKMRPAGTEDDDDGDLDNMGILDPSNWKWDELGLIAAKYQRRAVAMDHLLGPLEVTHNKRTVTRRANDEKSGPAVKPQQLQAQDITNNTNETSHIVQRISGLLQRVGGSNGINLFQFAIDPTSFSNTVENLFHISFLIRDGRASIETENEDEEPILLSCEQAQQEDYEQGLRRRQIVLELDVETWRGLVRAYNIQHAVIKHDEIDQSNSADTWATSRPTNST